MRPAKLPRRLRTLKFEPLESRQVLSASSAALGQLVMPKVHAAPAASPRATPAGYSPAQATQAYGFNNIVFTGGIVGDGRGQTIAIVDAYNDPNVVGDLHTFDQQFGLADPPSFKVVNQTGGTKLPKSDRGWASEIALDVEWAHAIAPGANILLVEANSNYTSDLDRALDYARSAPGVVVVSNSWGGSEYNGESAEDVHFTTPSGHAGVTFTVAAGDNGAPAEYPSSSPDVLSVGGTTLRLTASNDWSSETVWSGGGGGSSRYEGLPSYQTGLGLTNRGTPDVAYDADPYSGFAVYDSYGSGGWAVYGGTSVGAPQWAALIAIADQGRALAGRGSLANAQKVIYSLPATDFHDITSGSNGSSATNGYDLASGRGSPIANLVIADLVAYTGSTSFTVATPIISTPPRRRGWFFGLDMPGSGASVGITSGAAPAQLAMGDAAVNAAKVPIFANVDASLTAASDSPPQDGKSFRAIDVASAFHFGRSARRSSAPGQAATDAFFAEFSSTCLADSPA